MEVIVWQPGFSVGVEELDRQHKNLIKLINQLIEAEDVHVRSEIISDTLTSLIEYTNYHFKSEETYMQDYDYPDYEEHRQQHLKFVRRLAELATAATNHEDSLPEDLLTYLKSWLTNHILHKDMAYKGFFQEKGLS